MQELSRTQLFAGCSARRLRRADRFGTTIDVLPGQRLSTATEHPAQLVIIVSGVAAALELSGPVQWFGPGDAFGAGTAFDASPTVIAVTAGTVLAIARNERPGFFATCPMVAMRLNEVTTSPRSDTRVEHVAARLAADALMRAVS